MTPSKKSSADIQQLFNTIAPNYDRTNVFISLGCNALWYRSFISAIVRDHPPKAMLDLCCGTGAITQRVAREMKKRNLPLPSFDCLDFSEKMLERAQEEFLKIGVSANCIQADASLLPFKDASYDTITISYGIRNLINKRQALCEAMRVLQPHGKLFILELTPPNSCVVRFFHTLYMKTAVPLLGKLLTRHRTPYEYLDHSIEQFSQSELLSTLHDIGFACHKPISLSWGIATIIKAEKI